MREIKFRAWDTAKDEWIYVSLGDLVCGATSKPSVALGDEFEVADGDKSTNGEFIAWEQYTGLKDKNGKEIYEGDVVKYDESDEINHWVAGETAVVVWVAPRFTFRMKPYNESSGSNQNMPSEDDSEFLEIIGNIYENPELLTV